MDKIPNILRDNYMIKHGQFDKSFIDAPNPFYGIGPGVLGYIAPGNLCNSLMIPRSGKW